MTDDVPRAAGEPLAAAYDLLMLDLDGVVYIGGEAVEGAPDHLREARRSGAHVAFITNNASRTPEQVAQHLAELGIDASVGDVVTSAQAAARMLRDEHGEGARVAVLGTTGLVEALRAEGLVPTAVGEDSVAIVSGYGPDVPWRDVMRAATDIQDGLPWVASNTDMTIPTAYGVAPGHGVQVQLLSSFSGVEPRVAGKPAKPLLDETVRRVGGSKPLMVGDRLDTDIAGAAAAGVDSLLVMTGVTGLDELVGASGEERPTYVAADLGGLTATWGVPERTGSGWAHEGWTAEVHEGRLRVTGDGPPGAWWRVVAASAWQWRDEHGDVVDTAGLDVPRSGSRRSG